MNKKELVGAVADHCGTTQAQAGEFVNAFRPSREMRNPATGKMMMSKAKNSCQFKPSAGLKDL